jgi:hypothetical protein
VHWHYGYDDSYSALLVRIPEKMDSLADAYRVAGDFHPDISLAIANFYEKAGGQTAKRDAYLRQIADRPGYEEGSAREACARLGAELLRSGKIEEGRKYLWMAARHAQRSGASLEAQERIVRSLRP